MEKQNNPPAATIHTTQVGYWWSKILFDAFFLGQRADANVGQSPFLLTKKRRMEKGEETEADESVLHQDRGDQTILEGEKPLAT